MSRHKPGPRSARSLVMYVAVSAALPLACSGKTPREEERRAQTPPIVKAPPGPVKPRVPKGPIRNPQKDRPPDRSGEQLAAKELDAALKESAAASKKGDLLHALRVLRKCINKLQPSARCEGEYAHLAYESGRRRAEVEYYLEEVAKLDDPKATAGLWRRVGDTAMKTAKYDVAVATLQKLTEMPKKKVKAEDWAAYAKALQALGNKDQAVIALETAYERDPKHHDWLFERAVLAAQLLRTEEATKLMQEFYKKTKGKDPKRDELVKQRIAELGGEPPK